MKNYWNVLFLAGGLIVAQACTSKSEKKTDDFLTETTDEADQALSTKAENRARIEKDRVERLERRRLALEERAKNEISYTNLAGGKVYYKSEIAPMFVGGDKAMMEYLRDNIQFPEDASKKGLEGTVFVDFVVDQNGVVRDAEVTEATNDEVDQSFRNEALRLVNSMPNWTPGRQNGDAVDVKFSIPLTFQLD